jgi:saccharopine dehydrogenase (NAD+, L-lysine-forming)
MFLFIRKETIPNEFRTPIIPKDISILLQHNYTVFVESSSSRCFTDDEFKKHGAIIVNDKWFHYNAIILGLKELDHLEYLDHHVHIYFAHCYKEQSNSNYILTQFKRSNSILYDLEYFTYTNHQRFLAFGFYAGIAGCVIALKKYYDKLSIPLTYINNLDDNIRDLSNYKKKPSVAVIGNYGRCGQGVSHILKQLRIKYVGYTSEHKKTSLEQYDIVFNCIYLKHYIHPWFTHNTLFKKPIIICDVSCDPQHLYNPIQIYNEPTTWENPIYQYNENVSIIAIDNLPSLIPIESSTYFSNKMIELLLLKQKDEQDIWKRNLRLYDSKVKSLE